MGVWYAVEGEMRVKDTKKTRELLEQLEEDASTEMNVGVEEHDDKTMTVSICGGQQCSYSTCECIDNALIAFGPYLADKSKAVCFRTNLDDEEGEVWVGSEKAVKKGQRAALVDEAREAIRKLTPKEWEDLYEEVTDPHFWIGSNSPDDEEDSDEDE